MFIGGMAEAKSKGRGEECISQNLRILRGQNGKRIMLFFANSQRKELKRYVSIPCTCFTLSIPSIGTKLVLFGLFEPRLTALAVNCVASFKPPKKAGRPVVVELNPNFDILAQMRTLTIQFLDDEGKFTTDPFREVRAIAYFASRLPQFLPAAFDGSYDWMISLFLFFAFFESLFAFSDVLWGLPVIPFCCINVHGRGFWCLV